METANCLSQHWFNGVDSGFARGARYLFQTVSLTICLWTTIIILLIEKLGWFIPSLILELILFNKLTSGFHASVLLSIMITFVMFIVNHKAIAEWILLTTSANVITKVIVSNRADALKSEVNLFFTMIINNKLSTCQLSLAVPTFAYQGTCMSA